MKRLPILTGVVLLAVIVVWVSGVPSRGQTKSGSNQQDSAEKQPDKKEAVPAKSPASDAESAAKSSEARVFFRNARQKLFAYRSIRSTIVEKVVIGERYFRAEGRYVQGSSLQGEDLKLRLEYQIHVGPKGKDGLQGELEQVSDGKVLWTRHQIGTNTRVTRRNIRTILDAAQKQSNDPRQILVAQLGLGGLPSMLASIERTMDFESVTEEELGGKSFTVVSVHWNEDFLQRTHGVTVDKESDRLPDHIPDSLKIYFEKGNLFPRRFMYLKKHETREVSLPMVDLQLQKIELNKPVDEKEFVFTPPKGVFQADVTDVYIRLLQQPSQAENQAASQPTPAKTGK